MLILPSLTEKLYQYLKNPKFKIDVVWDDFKDDDLDKVV